MVRVPDFIVRFVFEPAWDLYEGSIRLKTLRDLEKSQWFSAEKLRSTQNERLRRLIQHAASTCPFYRDRFLQLGISPDGIQSVDDLAKIPLLTKADIRNNLDDILSESFAREKLVSVKTGGSTGVSLELFCDRTNVQLRNAGALRVNQWSGWKMGEPLAATWGNPPTNQPWKTNLRGMLKERMIYLDTMKIDNEAIDHFVSEWSRIRPGMLYGHAHSLFIFAENILERKIHLLPIHGIISTSMMLLDSERKVIEAAFNVPVTNRYGCEEVSLIGCECERHNGMHLNVEQRVVEFLRSDGTPCSPGEDGRIVVTDLTNFGMPIIRYEVGDRGIPSDRNCPCGRGLPLMESITGRTADFLVSQGGYRVAGISLIENTLTKFPGIQQLQFIQDEHLQLRVNLVPGSEYGDDTQTALVSTLRNMLGEHFQISVTHVQAIPQETSGKYRFSICNL